MKKALLVFHLTALLSVKTIAQITYTKDDLPGISSYTVVNGEMDLSVIIPSSGETQSWDYSGIVGADTNIITLKEASTSPYHSQFPDATLVYEMHADNAGASILFLKEGSQGLYTEGVVNAETYFLMKYSKPSLLFAAPISFGGTVQDSSRYFVETNSNSIKSTYTYFVRQTFSAVGYGSISTPAGTFENSLLIKKVEYSYDTTSSTATETAEIKLDTVTTYTWVQKDKTLPIIMEIVTDFSGKNIVNTSYYIKENVTGVDKNNESFLTHYPVPANDFFSIQLKDEQSGVLTLFSTNGRPVLTQQLNFSNNITINTSELLSGIYFYEITLENGSKIVEKITINH